MDTISGNYSSFLDNAYDVGTFDQTYRGNPSLPGYFGITTCSNRVKSIWVCNSNLIPITNFTRPLSLPSQDDYRYSDPCRLDDASGIVRFVDDAGGPGNRVRVVLTYRHPLITPLLLDTWWPTLRLTSQREGIVEKFRTSRVTGLVGAIAQAATHTPTPYRLPIRRQLPIPQHQRIHPPQPRFHRSTIVIGRGILMQRWNGISGTSILNLTGSANYPYNPDQNTLLGSFQIPVNSGDNYGTRTMGWVCAPQDGEYTFYVSSDDSFGTIPKLYL